MKDRINVIYDSIYDNERFEQTRQFLFDEHAEEENWLLPADVPDAMIFEHLNFEDQADWDYFEAEMKRLLEKNCYLITGTCGRWDGPARGGQFIRSFLDLQNVIGHLDYLKIFDKNGHLYINGIHHDGSDSYEIKRLTRKGYELAESNYFAHDKKLHDTIMKNSFYSALPNLSEELFGA